MKVKEIMHGITVVGLGSSVFDVAALMSKKNIGSVIVKDRDCVRIVTERDIINKVVALGRDPKKTKVSEIMSDCVHTIDAEKDVFDASDILNKYHIRRIPVTEKGEIVGIVTARDIAKSLSYLAARRLIRDEEYNRRGFERPSPYP